MERYQQIEIVKVHEIWPDTPVTITLFLAHSTLHHTFTIWAQRLDDASTVFSNKYFDAEVDARKAFELLTDVLVEINDPEILLLQASFMIDPK